MIAARRIGTCLLVATTAVVGLLATAGFASAPAAAATDPGTLLGQGGSFAEPVISKLLTDDGQNVAPMLASYFLTDNSSGINAFIGSSPGEFGADFAVSERPLTAAEAATSIANGRPFAYVPIESTPVALATLVPTSAWSLGGSSSIDTSGFCLHPPMTVALLGQIFGDATPQLSHWNDSRITCPEPGGPGTTADALSVQLWANLDPSQANYATMALLDSTPGSKADFQAGLSGTGSLTTDTTPSQLWPYAQNTIPGGDQPLIGKLLDINAETNTPSTNATFWQLGSITPMSSVWTGSPLGVPWNLATSAIQNADATQTFVAPSAAAAAAAASHTTLAATSDPTTNNLVTFDASTTDAAAYNNYMMAESYLVVPTKGLSAAKANALAQIIRFAVGTTGEADITRFGAAPATAAMQAADLKVAAQLNASAAAATNPNAATGSTTTTTAPGGAGGGAAGSAGSTGSGSTGTDPSSTGSSGTGTDTSGGLAFTGSANLGTWVAIGAALFVMGELVRRRLKRREVPA